MSRLNVVFIVIVAIVSCEACAMMNRETIVSKKEMLAFDFRLFQETPAWDFAKAVADEDLEEIEKQVGSSKYMIDYTESRFGQSLLMLAIQNNKYESFKKLLELGANPNHVSGGIGVAEEAIVYGVKKREHKYTKLLLEKGANPNGVIRDSDTTPLMEACGMRDNFENIKLLVDSGADVNFKNDVDYGPIRICIIHDNMKGTLYLLKEGADHKVTYNDLSGNRKTIASALRVCAYPLGSDKHTVKMLVVDYLESKGLEYHNLPIPPAIVNKARREYPDSWQEYLEQY